MKEIDFLPTWYKSSKRWQVSYRSIYAGIGAIFIAMTAWNVFATSSLSRLAAKLDQAEKKLISTENATQEFSKIKSELVQLQSKDKVVKEIDSKINVANVLAEISFLLDKRIVLSKVEFIAEKYGQIADGKTNISSAIKAAPDNVSGKNVLPIGNVRFKVLINGVASDASDVATLICRMEDSPYFCQVIPLFTKNKEMKTSTNAGGDKIQISEFEIRCNLANYRYEEPYFAEELQNTITAGL